MVGATSEETPSIPRPLTDLPKKFRMLPWLGAVAAIAILAAGGLLFRRQPMVQPPTVSAPITIEIRTNPPGARLLVDGELKGASNLSLSLPVGTHEIRAELEGYEEGMAVANLSEGGLVSPVEINLKPRAAPTIPEAVSATLPERTSSPAMATKTRQEPLIASAKSVAPREVVELKPGLGVLVLKRSPAAAQVSIQGAGDLNPRPIREDRLELLEGSYTLTATAPGFVKTTIAASVEAAKTNEIAFELQPEKESPADWKAVWEKPDGWNIEGDWLVRRGGNFVISNFPAKAGSYSFVVWRKGKSAQWVVNFQDEKNYCLFEIQSKSLSRTVVRNGRKGLAIKVRHTYEKQNTYTLQVSVTGNSITHRILDGKSWVLLDELKLAGPDLSVGKFGIFVPGNDQIGFARLSFKPI